MTDDMTSAYFVQSFVIQLSMFIGIADLFQRVALTINISSVSLDWKIRWIIHSHAVRSKTGQQSNFMSSCFIQLSDSEGNALAMTYINPPVTTKTNHNPSMRVFYLDPATYDVIDYEQYGFNLLEAAGKDFILSVVSLLVPG